jgi:hypothetical protein
MNQTQNQPEYITAAMVGGRLIQPDMPWLCCRPTTISQKTISARQKMNQTQNQPKYITTAMFAVAWPFRPNTKLSCEWVDKGGKVK